MKEVNGADGVEVRHVYKSFGRERVLIDVNLDPAGEHPRGGGK